jgi:hypothetical protein
MSKKPVLPIPTRAMWVKARAYQKGYWSYMYAAHEGSQIPDENPYIEGNWAWHQFRLGQQAAVRAAQDSEE